MITRTKYNPKEIESKWQAQWEADQQYHASDDLSKPKVLSSSNVPLSLWRPPYGTLVQLLTLRYLWPLQAYARL